jgi:TPR repeat protein
MKITLAFATLAIMLTSGTVCVAQEAVYPPGPCKFSESDPFAAAQQCKALADGGDADALYQFGIMLLNFAPQPGQASREELEKWKPLGSMFDGSKYLDLAAEKGNKTAMEHKCRIASDRYAPADLQREGEKYCAKLKE